MAVEKRAVASWEGSLVEGSGRVELASGVAGEIPVTWAARTDAGEDKTSPEELIAGAHAACFSKALSNMLAKAGHPARRLEVAATCAFDKQDEGWSITRVDLEVRGDVPGMEASEFQDHAAAAKDGCPVSRALKGNVQIGVKASFV